MLFPAGENKVTLALWVPDSTSRAANHLAKRGSGIPGRGHSNRPTGRCGRLPDRGRELGLTASLTIRESEPDLHCEATAVRDVDAG